MTSQFPKVIFSACVLTLGLVLGGAMGTASAALTDIANVPITNGAGASVQPNIMLVLDTSQSMAWTGMPNSIEIPGAVQPKGYKSYQCNALYYNPNRTYVLPQDYTNALLPTPSFNAAPYNYYVPANPPVVVNLATQFQAHDVNTVQSPVLSQPDTPQQAYYFVYTGTATLSPTSSPCTDADNTTPGTSVAASSSNDYWKRVLVSANSGPGGTDERTNFAIWYTYYRTRMALAKSAVGLAFGPLTNNFRVGFLTVSPNMSSVNGVPTVNSTVQSNHYTPIGNFDSTQRASWYSMVYSQSPIGSHPAREALARVGRHYAGMTDGINSGMPQDPVQLACQPNFAIMTTDGYWDVAAEAAAPGGGPTNIAANAWVGEQDGVWTPDTGLVPTGVYDGTTSQLGYTDNSTTTTSYSYQPCSLSTTGQYTQTGVQYPTVYKKVVTTPVVNNNSQAQQRTATIVQTTYTVTKTTTQIVQQGSSTTQTTSQSVWFNPTTELSNPVPSCANYPTNCTTTTTGPTVVSSCTPVIPSAPTYMTVNCVQSSSSTPVASCPNGATCVTNTTGPTQVAGNACTSASASSSNSYTKTTCTQSTVSTTNVATLCSASYSASANTTCAYSYTGWTNVSSCTAGTSFTGSPPSETQCQTVNSCVPNSTNTCTATSTTTYGGSCTANSTTTCTVVQQPSSVTSNVSPSSCSNVTPSASNGWIGSNCTVQTSATTAVPSCSPVTASANNNWTATLCTTTTIPGEYLQTQAVTNTTRTYSNGVQSVLTPTTTTSVGVCINPATAPALPTSTTVTNPPHSVASSSTGGSLNSLADVAQYYYATDLRPNMPDIVRPAGTGWDDDRANWQHMTTFVVGLGVSGTLPYIDNYATSSTGAFASIRAGTSSWPLWPDPSINYVTNTNAYNSPQSIDDFWHAATDGRGHYFNANNPASVVSGITNALATITATASAGSGVTLSDQSGKTDSGVNFETSYTTVTWTGDLQAYQPTSSTTTILWSAKTSLATLVQAACDNRVIYVRNPSATNSLGNFTWNTQNCATGSSSTGLTSAMQAQITATGLSQYSTMTTGANGSVNQQAQATGASLVNYVRGQSQNEGFSPGVSGALYRSRSSVLGDIINSKAQYVGAPYYNYVDVGYSSFKSAQANRTPMLYVGANDGMLHAFYAASSSSVTAGKEAWAYIPTAVVPNLSKLADNNYSNNHQFYVDGTPTIADVQSGGVWRTILVGGLNAGGNAYYALDITNPAAPISLWEFSNASCSGCSVGLSFGAPVVGKLTDGTWVVFLTSGYNNSTGQGTLYVVNAVTGALIRSISTQVGSPTSPSGLAQIAAWSTYPALDATVQRIYGGDLLGNIWRFDVNGTLNGPGYNAFLMGVAKDPTGATQSITTAPEVGLVDSTPYVYVGTGRLLGLSDYQNFQVQTVYGLADRLSNATTLSNLRAVLTPYATTSFTAPSVSLSVGYQCTLSAAACSTPNAYGFYIDLSNSQQQIITPLTLVGSTLSVTTYQPTSGGACSTGGVAANYFVDGSSGAQVAQGLVISTNGLAGITYVNGSSTDTGTATSSSGSSSTVSLQGSPTPGQTCGEVRDSSGANLGCFTPPQNTPPPGTHRTSWREINQQ